MWRRVTASAYSVRSGFLLLTAPTVSVFRLQSHSNSRGSSAAVTSGKPLPHRVRRKEGHLRSGAGRTTVKQRPRYTRQTSSDNHASDRIPQSLDINEVEDKMDVERFFPEAIAHLKSPPMTTYAADEQRRRHWRETTHALNADGYRPAEKETEEEQHDREHSFFEEGGVDIRGGLREAERTKGPWASPPSKKEALSPDVLQLTGGVARRHGAALAEQSNNAPADLTMEGDVGGERGEFGDTPVQVTDMLRERLMELKAEKLREERNDTFMPRRLSLASDAELRMRKDKVSGQQDALLALATKVPTKTARSSTLADIADDEVDNEYVGDYTPAILRDGISSSRAQQAAALLFNTEAYVPGTSQRDPLRDSSGFGATHRRIHSPQLHGVVYLLRVLPRAGYCSRREASAIIASGQVRVNNVVERNPFYLVRPEDDVHVAGHASRLRYAPPRLWMYHKPANVIVSRNDVSGRALITKHARILGMDHLIPVGSLPMRTHGILLLSNDGELVSFLESPKSMIQQTYLLRVRPAIDPVLAHKLNTDGVNINGKQYRGAEFLVNPATKSRFSVKVKMRALAMPVAHLFQHLGRTIERGGRISYGPYALGTLAVGSIREVTIPPHYSEHLGAIWKPFVERDWPYFRRQRVARLRRLSRYRELTPKELEELDNFTYEEVHEALSFGSQELKATADAMAERMAGIHQVHQKPMPSTFTSSAESPGDVFADGWQYDDSIIEDITKAE